VGSLLAGGIGIDLTAASVVIHYDRWWNASKENQATDRVYRIGQNKNVQVLKMVTRGTLEEKIDALINVKRELFEKFMDRDEEIFKTLTRSQLIDLLQ
ncbi:MAG: C-terminal helicase domain-containing protein, partial [Proteobacteria bacterium]|nr:C-terminal helicase domain-containing protein [Pseudomonadota bacterium]